MSKLSDNLTKHILNSRLAFQTRDNYLKYVQRFADFLRLRNINIESAQYIKVSHVTDYAKHRLDDGIKKRTICNEIAALRTALTQAGREKFAKDEGIDNNTLGISGGSRIGTKVAISYEHLLEVVEAAALRDVGLAICILLSYYLGLRSEEAVQSNKSIKTWLKAIRNNDKSVRVIFGTKNERPRDTTVHDHEAVIPVLDYALEIMKSRKGLLINKDGLESAMNYYHYNCGLVGLVGEHAPHSLRYAYAQNGMQRYKAEDFSLKENIAQVSMDLGHGSGRGRFVVSVYGRSLLVKWKHE